MAAAAMAMLVAIFGCLRASDPPALANVRAVPQQKLIRNVVDVLAWNGAYDGVSNDTDDAATVDGDADTDTTWWWWWRCAPEGATACLLPSVGPC